MNRKATFAVKNAKANSSDHNSRKNMPKYLIEIDPNFTGNSYAKFGNYQDDKQYREYAKKLYTEKFLERKNQAQTMQKSQVKALIKEVVITIEKHHTQKDIIELFDKLREKKGGYHILEVAEHRDEGHFERVGKHGEWGKLTYYPTKDILLKKDGNWYIKSDETKEAKSENAFNIKADMSEFKKVYNYHFHVKFTNFDERTGLTSRLSKMDVSGEGRLKQVAKHLGLKYAPEEKIPLEQGVKSVKEQHHINRQNRYKQILENQKSQEESRELKKENQDLKIKNQKLKLKVGEVRSELQDLKAQRIDANKLNREADKGNLYGADEQRELNRLIKSLSAKNISDVYQKLQELKIEHQKRVKEAKEFEQVKADIKDRLKVNTEESRKMEEVKQVVQKSKEAQALKAEITASKKLPLDELEKKYTTKTITGKKLDTEGFKAEVQKEFKAIQEEHRVNYKGYRKQLQNMEEFIHKTGTYIKSKWKQLKALVQEKQKQPEVKKETNEKNQKALQEKIIERQNERKEKADYGKER
jgi:hypothetical protein